MDWNKLSTLIQINPLIIFEIIDHKYMLSSLQTLEADKFGWCFQARHKKRLSEKKKKSLFFKIVHLVL